MEENFEVKDHAVSKEVFTLDYNAKHHMFFTRPRPSEENLPSYYKSENYISHTDAKRSLFERVYHLIKSITLSRKHKLITSYIPSASNILDIGAGTGDFLKYMDNKAWTVTGVEPHESARKNATSKGILLQSTLPETAKKFQAITMWHVLEHVYDLESQIKWLKKHLADDGHCFIAVPNFESYDAKYYRDFWAAYDVPRHLYHFSKKAIKSLFANEGLEVVHMHPMLFDAYYVSLLSEKYKTGKMNFLSAARIGWKSNRRAKSDLNHSSLIYVIKHKNSKY